MKRTKNEMTPLELLRAEFKIPKKNIFIIPEEDAEKIELEPLVSAVSDDDDYVNNDIFFGDGENLWHDGENCAITILYSFHGGTDQRWSIHRIFLFEGKVKKGIDECHKALKKHW